MKSTASIPLHLKASVVMAKIYIIIVIIIIIIINNNLYL